jgi:glycopeptide antibiotics resistance protein
MLLEFDSTAWLVSLCILAVILVVLRRRGRYYLFFFSIFWIYLSVLVSVVLFPVPLGMDGGYRLKSIWAQIDFMFKYSGLNLVPFYFGNCWDLPRACAYGIYENILMTIPFGFGINFIARLRQRDIAWLVLALGLLIETSQFVLDLALGGVFRSVDANDVLFNGLGVCLGYGLFLGFAWLFLSITRRFELRQAGLLAYLQAVSSPVEAVGTNRLLRASVEKELKR